MEPFNSQTKLDSLATVEPFNSQTKLDSLATMEPFNSQTRADESQNSSNTNIGPSNIIDKKPSNEQALIVLSSTTTQTYNTSSSTQPYKISTTRPCFLSHPYMPQSLFCGPNQDPRDILVERQIPNNFDITLDVLPLTKCTKHRNVGFLPLDYVRKFHEYIRMTKKYRIFQINQTFEDCIFEFPNIHPIGSSKQRFQEICLRKCYQCHVWISRGRDVYMYKDCVFCDTECRDHATAARSYYKKMMKAVKNVDIGGESSSGEKCIFTIE